MVVVVAAENAVFPTLSSLVPRHVFCIQDGTARMLSIRRAAHVIKGAAASIMCIELQNTAKIVEDLAKEERIDSIGVAIQNLNKAAENYRSYLGSIGINTTS